MRRKGRRITNRRIFSKYCVPRSFVATFMGQVYPVSRVSRLLSPARAAAGRVAASWRQRGHGALVRASMLDKGNLQLQELGGQWNTGRPILIDIERLVRKW